MASLAIPMTALRQLSTDQPDGVYDVWYENYNPLGVYDISDYTSLISRDTDVY